MARVTVVNDNPEFLELVDDILEDDRYATTTIDGDAPDALEQILASRPELLIIDVRLGDPGDHGWQIAQQVRAEPGLDGLPILLCSADIQALEELADEVARRQRVEALAKPFSVDQLTDAVERLLEDRAVNPR
jgi:CheY-like chemotaxis protein